MDALKNRNIQIALGVVLLVLVGLSGFYFVASKNAAEPEDTQSSEAVVKTVDPEEIGLSMEATEDNKKVLFKIGKAEGIESIEYELVYEADLPPAERLEGGEDRVTRQVSGEAEVEKGQSSFESEPLDLGSCSRNVCKYDQGVDKVDLTLKITKSDNVTLQVTDSLELK